MPSMAPSATPLPARAAFVGRAAELAALGRGLEEAVRDGRPTTLVLTGAAGVGKSALVERHLAAQADAGARVIAARCKRGVRVPWGVIDEVTAALGDAVAGLPDRERRRLDLGELALAATLFPSLRRARIIAAATPAPPPGDLLELRRRGFAALSGLLAALAGHRGLVLAIDDSEWLDADGLVLLRHVLWDTDEPLRVQLILARREQASAGLPERAEHLVLGPLPIEDAAEVVAPRAPGLSPLQAAELARRAGGNPRLIELRARWEPAGVSIRTEATALDLIGHRLAGLEREARRAVEVVALAAQPIPRAAAARAAAVDEALLDTLIAKGWLHPAEARDRPAIDAERDVHDAVVAAASTGTRARRYLDLARQLELYGDAEAHLLALLLHRGGELHEAGRWAAIAAEQAGAQLAFDRAAWFYRMALALLPHADPRRHELRVGQAEALAHLGRAHEAAQSFAEAGADRAADSLELHKRMVEEYLLAGDLDDAMAAARAIVGDDAVAPPPGPARRRPSRSGRFALRWRTRRLAGNVAPGGGDPAELARADIYWSLGAGLWPVDHDLAVTYNARHLRLALRLGDPARIARGLALESAALAAAGRDRPAAELLDEARKLALSAGDSYGQAWSELAAAVSLCGTGQWRDALRETRAASEALRNGCRCVGFEHTAVALTQVTALYYLGELGDLARLVPARVRDAEERGDRLGSLALRSGLGNAAWLVGGDVDAAVRACDQAREGWHNGAANLLHLDMIARIHLALYRGDRAGAWQVIEDCWSAWQQSPMARLRRPRIEALHARAMAALAVAHERERMAADAERTGRELTAFRTPWTAALGQLVRAGGFCVTGDGDRAVSWLRAAESSLERVGMAAHATAARRRRGQVVGGSQGNTLIASADASLRARGVASPERFTDLLVPSLRE
jgi:eukaryotic-like serine/threonine-protein kinase